MTSRALVALALAAGACGARTDLLVEEPCAPTGEEVCDGRDNDCDGEVDEDITPISCGEHGCVTTVTCTDGAMPVCVPREPTPETCNLEDDDCDGEVDEGFGFGPLTAPIVLREDEHETGDCTSCRWAFGTTLTPTSDGFQAIWQLGLLGGEEQPNVYGRRLTPDGAIAGPIELLRDDFVLTLDPMTAQAPHPPRGLPVEARFRIGTDDIPAIMFVDDTGATDATLGTPASGGYGVPLTVWTGARFVSSWSEENQLHVAVLDANGAFLHELDVDPLERVAAITLGVYPGRVGILVSRYVEEPETRDQWLLVLDDLGEVVTPQRKLDLAYTNWQRLLGTEEGWLHIRPNDWDEASTRQRLDVDGDLLDEPTPFADGRHLSESGGSAYFGLPLQKEILAVWQSPWGGDMFVEFLDERGDPKRGWSGPVPMSPFGEDWLGDPHVAIEDGQVFVLWHGVAPNDQPNRVYLQSFGCTP